MRLQASFVVLLITAATAMSIVWRDFGAARDGDTLARLLVFTLVPLGLICITLLGRIVLKAKRGRDRSGEG